MVWLLAPSSSRVTFPIWSSRRRRSAPSGHRMPASGRLVQTSSTGPAVSSEKPYRSRNTMACSPAPWSRVRWRGTPAVTGSWPGDAKRDTRSSRSTRRRRPVSSSRWWRKTATRDRGAYRIPIWAVRTCACTTPSTSSRRIVRAGRSTRRCTLTDARRADGPGSGRTNVIGTRCTRSRTMNHRSRRSHPAAPIPLGTVRPRSQDPKGIRCLATKSLASRDRPVCRDGQMCRDGPTGGPETMSTERGTASGSGSMTVT